MPETPHITHTLKDGDWAPVQPPRGRIDAYNFLIVCDYGDWSGYRTLSGCLTQIPASWTHYQNGFYRIEER
jgi:hypothetical protein